MSRDIEMTASEVYISNYWSDDHVAIVRPCYFAWDGTMAPGGYEVRVFRERKHAGVVRVFVRRRFTDAVTLARRSLFH